MDSYPKELVSGLFPLVFAVNAISNVDESSLFETLLQSMASCRLDDTTAVVTSQKQRSISLFQTDEYDSSSDDDGLSVPRKRQSAFGFGRSSGKNTNEAMTDSTSGHMHATSYAKGLNSDGTSGTPDKPRGFFETARIVNISPRYGFPPSKDPDGTNNFAHELTSVLAQLQQDHYQNAPRAREREAIQALFSQYPVQGILAAGWLDKHIHALPSAIMVVCTVSANQSAQSQQDSHLLETIQHLQYSLVPKRQCSIQVVGIVQRDDPVTTAQSKEWSAAMSHELDMDDNNAITSFSVTVLRASGDLVASTKNTTVIIASPASNAASTSSASLQKLHRTVRDASLQYYLTQARRTKEKLSRLAGCDEKDRRSSTAGHHAPVQLSCLLIRYCFKIAIFYEFQSKHGKSLRYLAAAYRYASKYYQWILCHPTKNKSISQSEHCEDEVTTPSAMAHQPVVAATDSSEAVEVELGSSERSAPSDMNGYGRKILWSKVVPLPPDDILHQCRAVAEWLNVKLVSSGITSHSEGGLLAAANQWRVHSRLFGSRRHPTSIEDWYEWSYIVRQRTVIANLVEEHPPKALGELGQSFDDVVLRCSPWRTLESTAEAMLALGREVEKLRNSDKYVMDDSSRRNEFRARYVGGVSPYGFEVEFQKELEVNHREKGLELILKAISLFEHELQAEKRGFYADDDFRESSSSRTGARLYYLAGGILLGLKRHEEAVRHLIKATRYSQGWQELELAVRRMLIECYETHMPSQSDAPESSQNLASMILDSYFNAEMSSQDLRRALDHFASISGGDSLQWYHETTDEEDTSLPFSFAVSFPGITHATSGDTVEASVVIKSNLDYAVHVKSVSLGTLVGNIPIPPNDLLSAANASEGTEGGIIIQAKTAIVVSTQFELPKDLSAIASDESGNGGELQGTAGKGSFSKNAKPRSAGITSAGGARLVREDMLLPGNSNAQGWNVRFLGGKPLLCDGLKMAFYPVQAEISGRAEKANLIELTIEKKKKRTAANIKRTPFEEENYTTSAWSRPQHVPFSRGPRSLRVLGPQPGLVISDLTDPVTNGTALEGTVNRIILKLQAGSTEQCVQMKVTVSCFSVLVTPSGSTKRLVTKEELTQEAENSINMSNARLRTPCLVQQSPSNVDHECKSAFGYELPPGWQSCGTGQKDISKYVSDLKGGESSFLHVDFFRPAAYAMKECIVEEGEIHDDDLSDVSLCKTDYYVTLTYNQLRPSTKKQKPVRRTTRKRPVMASSPKGVPGKDSESRKEEFNQVHENYDEVSLEYTGSVVWAQPMSAIFSPGKSTTFPLGSTHVSNNTQNEFSDLNAEELLLVDNADVGMQCDLQLHSSIEGLNTEVIAVRFEDNVEEGSPVSVVLRTGDSPREPNLICEVGDDDPCRIISKKSKFGIAYTVRPTLRNHARQTRVLSALGSLLVDWRPSALALPAEIDVLPKSFGGMKAHGPLALERSSTIRFTGPHCCINSAPFEAKAITTPPFPKVATPFKVSYIIKNRTNQHQSISLAINEGAGAGTYTLLVCGYTTGHLSLGPSEEQSVVLTVIAMRPGETAIPPLQVSSDRFSSWIINSGLGNGSVVVLP